MHHLHHQTRIRHLVFRSIFTSIPIVLLFASSYSWVDAAPPADTPPTGDQCLTEGYFCFEVTRGPRYSYRIHPDEERVLFSTFAYRISNSTFAWNISLHESIDDGQASIMFLQQDQVNPALKLEVNKQEGDSLTFKIYQWMGDQDGWSRLSVSKRKDLYNDLVKQQHSVSLVTTVLFDELLGLEDKNLTIGLQMKIEMVNGEAAREVIDFGTQDGHFFFRDKPEIREYREKRKLARQMEKAATSTLVIIILSIVAVIIVSAVVIAICMISRSVTNQREKRNSSIRTPAPANKFFSWSKKDSKDQEADEETTPAVVDSSSS